MDFNHVTQDERERLYNEVWTEPVIVVAQRYGMSDNGLRKHLKRLWIPLPPSGYWAKVKAGQKIAKPDLPKVRGELKKHVRNYFIKYREDLEQLTDDELKAAEGLSMLTNETIAAILEICSQTQVKSQLRNPHSLIAEHKEESVYRKKRDKTLQQASFNTNYYNITKSKYRDNKAMLPINVSDVNLNRAYRILDTLIHAFDDMEGYTNVSLESGKDRAYFAVMRTDFYFEIKEENRKKRKSSNDEEMRPLLVLSMQSDDSYRGGIHYKLEYKDKDNEPLEEQVGEIIYEMFVAANKMLVASKLAHRELEREIEEDRRQQRLERMRKGELEELKLLEQAASDWDKAQRIRRFADEMAEKINEVTNEEKREKLAKWLKWARNKADWLDPLTEKEDELLGKSKHLLDMILEIE